MHTNNTNHKHNINNVPRGPVFISLAKGMLNVPRGLVLVIYIYIYVYIKGNYMCVYDISNIYMFITHI